MKKLHFFLFFIICIEPFWCQSKFYLRTGTQSEASPIIAATDDGGFIVCSCIYNGDQKTNLLKFDKCGNVQWSKIILAFPAGDMIILKSGNILLSSCYKTSPKLIKLDENGNVICSKEYTNGAVEYFVYSAGEFSNGELFFNGNATMIPGGPENYAFIIKTDSGGNIIWNKKYGQVCCYGFAIACDDGGVLSKSGWSSFKTDAFGNILWSRTFSTNNSFKPLEVKDGFVFAKYGGTALSDTGLLYKTDKLGNLLWKGEMFKVNYIRTLKRLPNGNFLMIGSSKISQNEYRYIPTFIETDSLGRFLSQKTYNPASLMVNSYKGEGYCQLNDGSFLFTGTESSFGTGPLYVSKISKQGVLGCGDSAITEYFPAPKLSVTNYPLSPNNFSFTSSNYNINVANNEIIGERICQGYDKLEFNLPEFSCLPQNGNLILSGPPGFNYLWSTGATSVAITVTQTGVYILRIIDPCVNYTYTSETTVINCEYVSLSENTQNETFKVFPNPSTGKVTVQTVNPSIKTDVVIYNVLGETVLKSSFNNTDIEIDLSFHSKGIYFIEFFFDGKNSMKKIVLY